MRLTKKKLSERTRIRFMEKEIKRRARYSLALLGMGFVRNGAGRFINI
jgi:hypothetical protein